MKMASVIAIAIAREVKRSVVAPFQLVEWQILKMGSRYGVSKFKNNGIGRLCFCSIINSENRSPTSELDEQKRFDLSLEFGKTTKAHCSAFDVR